MTKKTKTAVEKSELVWEYAINIADVITPTLVDTFKKIREEQAKKGLDDPDLDLICETMALFLIACGMNLPILDTEYLNKALDVAKETIKGLSKNAKGQTN